jgi:hypothetical protein
MARRDLIFRVFVSSTFTDLIAERNALHKLVFPRLRQYCQERGARFQAIDLRWGVREQAALDQQTMRICFEEIARCQRVTPRPNFIVLLGDRYGWCPLPYEIPAGEFEEILEQIRDPDDRTLLTAWYRRDDNAVPPVYDLQPRMGQFKELTRWEPVERYLRLVLRKAAEDAGLSSEEIIKYKASATEQEIIRGTVEVEDAREHVFCFLRRINNLPQDHTAQEFIDLDKDDNPDFEAQSQLADLKERLRELLPLNTSTNSVRMFSGASSA